MARKKTALEAKPPAALMPIDENVKGSLNTVKVLSQIVKPLVSEGTHVDKAIDLAAELIREMQPQSPIERMLLEQMVMTHAQVQTMHLYLSNVREYDRIEQVAGIVGKMQGEFRKTLLTLKELRTPPRSIIMAQQANIAQQQIVNQSPNERTRGE